MENLSSYLSNFDERELIDVFSELLKADEPTTAPMRNDYDITDVELFLEKYCVAFSEDGIGQLIVDEWNKRKSVFDCVTNEDARQMAIDALKSHFFYDGYTFNKANSICASAFDVLEGTYKLFEIPMGDEYEDGDNLVLAMDFSKATFDVENFINPDWALWNGEIETIINYAKENTED